MGRFKSEVARVIKGMKRDASPNVIEVPIPKGFRNNPRNQQIFKQIYAKRAEKAALKLKENADGRTESRDTGASETEEIKEKPNRWRGEE